MELYGIAPLIGNDFDLHHYLPRCGRIRVGVVDVLPHFRKLLIEAFLQASVHQVGQAFDGSFSHCLFLLPSDGTGLSEPPSIFAGCSCVPKLAIRLLTSS